jgi:sortase (surface protein transpeptidase)
MKIPRGQTRREAAWWGMSVLALVVGVVALVGTLSSNVPKEVVLSVASAAPKGPDEATPKFPSIPVSRPVRLKVPAIGISTAVGTLGLQPDHQVQVPTSTHVVDWYIDGPTPGQIGSAVMLGHVDSYLGPGTFFNLKSLKAGNAITVVLEDGVVEHFVVSRVVEYAKTSFPDRLVYGPHGIRELQLVTCGGVFDHETGHYESNIVVFSRLVSVQIPKRDASVLGHTRKFLIPT